MKTYIRGAAAPLSAIASGVLLCASPAAAESPAPSDIFQAIAAGTPIVEIRPRYELVDQANFAKAADAFTVRAHLGWQTARWDGIQALVEFEGVGAVGGSRFNSGENGRTRYPLIADPDVAEVNRAQVTWTPNAHFSATVGRQEINLDDQRFIGTANWRQDEQTFDAVRLDGAYGDWKATYIYLGRINRNGGIQDWDSDSHAVNLTYTASEALRLEGYVYAFDFKQSPANSSLTYGGRVTGQLKLAPARLSYAAAYARQTDYRDNPASFALNYWSGELAGTAGVFTLKANYEVLGGNGARGFATPLATLHIFQGWADVFLTTPPVGIRDANLSFVVQPRLRLKRLYNPAFMVRYNDFTAEHGGAGLGHEWDLQASAQFDPHLAGLVKYARYDGPTPVRAPYFSRSKVWVQLDYKL